MAIAAARPSRLRLTSPVPPETDLHVSVSDALRILLMPPAQWTTLAVGHCALPPRTAAKLSRLGVKPNWPDILVLFQGSCFGIELKKKVTGRLSTTRTVRSRTGVLRTIEGQQQFFPKLRQAGMDIAVCTDVAGVLSALAQWGVPLRGFS